ncbi:hypothetical protein [Mycobacterium lentiflavum]|uniref:hypothetical protein n=1 Tax=Mycobacterium lentiflavum TaxID=141349 RepID=UPI001586C6D6|nr:hypothetical protein [Mycobacterium lentiflavum]
MTTVLGRDVAREAYGAPQPAKMVGSYVVATVAGIDFPQVTAMHPASIYAAPPQ